MVVRSRSADKYELIWEGQSLVGQSKVTGIREAFPQTVWLDQI